MGWIARQTYSADVLDAPPPGFRACIACGTRGLTKSTVLYERIVGGERAFACICHNCSSHIQRAMKQSESCT